MTTKIFSIDPAYRIFLSSETKISVVHHLGMAGVSVEDAVVVGSSGFRNSFLDEENIRSYLVVNNTLFLLESCYYVCVRSCG